MVLRIKQEIQSFSNALHQLAFVGISTAITGEGSVI
jgi:hypothetical protein